MKYIFTCLMVLLPLLVSAGGMSAEQAVSNELVRMYQLDTTIYKVEVTSLHLKSADIASGEVSLQPLSQKEPLGLFTVIARITKDGEVVETGQVRFTIRKFADVLVTTDRIKRHDTFSSQNLTLRRMEITSLQERPLTDMAKLEGTWCTRNLRKGSILLSNAVEPVPDVEAGREVTIVYTNGLCQVSTTGIALQPGRAGDYVRVKNKSSSKIIYARIVDSKVVAVDP